LHNYKLSKVELLGIIESQKQRYLNIEGLNIIQSGTYMDSLDLVKLTALMKITSGRPEITVGLIDGPVVMNHSDLAGENIREMPGNQAHVIKPAV